MTEDIEQKLKSFYRDPKIEALMRKAPRVRVLDIEMNQKNDHWRPLIGQEGILLGTRTDDDGEICDVKMDYSEIPNQAVNTERFQILPSIENQENGTAAATPVPKPSLFDWIKRACKRG